MPRVTGLGGVFFKARDEKALAAWYRDHLGLPVEDGGWAVLTDYFGAGGQRAMLNYRVADLDAVLAARRREGVTVDERVESTDDGRFGWITDPEGNRVELWQPPEGR